MNERVKQRIINCIKWILKYKEPITPDIYIETRKIHKIKWSGILNEYSGIHEIKHRIIHEIAMELQKTDMIKIESEKEWKLNLDGTGNYPVYNVHAELMVITPSITHKQ